MRFENGFVERSSNGSRPVEEEITRDFILN